MPIHDRPWRHVTLSLATNDRSSQKSFYPLDDASRALLRSSAVSHTAPSSGCLTSPPTGCADDRTKEASWLVGSNYIPANAINELEMWQAETFDPTTIDKELGWAEGLGMTTMRVFLHDLPWQQDARGYQARINQFLDIAAKHKIKPLLVLFDSCWDPNPHLGKQHDPKPGVHNSGWLQAPGAKALQDSKEYPRLKTYVTGVVGAFGKDSRVLGWDVWNEPDNMGSGRCSASVPMADQLP